MKKQYLIVLFISILFILSCNRTNHTLVVYTTVDQVFSEPVLKAFEKETGIKVNVVYDAEETKSTGVLNRLIAEKNNPQCDLFWSGDPIRSNILKNKGITRAYCSKVAHDISRIYKDTTCHWIGFSARARVLIYNKNLLKKEDIPHSIFDLTKEKYKNNMAIANPLFGTTSFHIAALFTTLGDSTAKAFLSQLKNNGLLIATSNGDVKKRVSQGEIACGLTDTDDAYEAIKEGAPIGIVFLDQKGIGSLVMPNTVSLIKNKHKHTKAKQLMDYLLSKKTELLLAQLCAQMPLHKGVDIPTGILSLDSILSMNIDYDKTSLKLEAIQKYLKEWVEE